MLTEAELRNEVTKALTFQPPLQAFIVLTTAANDVAIQKVAREISAEHAKTGLFEVRVTGWDTFRHRVADHQDLLVKYFRDFAPVDVLGRLAASAEEQNQNFATIAKLMQTSNRLVTDLRDDRAGTDELASRVTEVSKLIGDGSPKAALKALDRIIAEEGASASPLAKYRILASKGNAHYALGDETAAVALFRQAHEAYPEFTNARATMAIAHLLEGDRETALEKAASALRDDPKSARTVGIVIDATAEGTPLAEIVALIPTELLDDVDIKLHLAMRAHSLGDHATHRRLAEEALALAPDDWRTLSALAEALVQPLAGMDGLALTHALPEDDRPDVERATELNGRAWTQLAQRDSSFQGRHVAANLISLLGLMGRDEEAEVVLDQALVSNPTYDPLAYRSAQRSAADGDWKGVAAAIDAIPEDEISFDSLLLRTQAALALGDAESAVDLQARLHERGAREPQMPERDQLLAALRVKAEVLKGADRNTAIEEAVGAAPAAIVLRSVLFDELPDGDPLRSRIVDEMRELAKGELTLRERVHAAETLYAAGHYSLAADLYAPLHERSDSHALRRRLHALHLADRRAEARKLFETLSGELRSNPSYLSLGINIYESVGLLKPALKLLEQAIAMHDALRNRLAWMQLLVRLGRRDQITPWLEQVSEDVEGTSGELMSLARIIDQYVGRDRRALTIGYRALRAGYGRPEIHLGYAMGLVVNGKPDEAAMSAPAAVEPGTGVALLNEATGDTLFRIVETVPDPIIERGELAVGDPFAKRLLGLKVGDAIDVAKAGVPAQTHRIVDIQSRFLFAFRRTMRDFPTLFPENPAFGSFEIDDSKGDDRFEQMFALARQRAEQGSEIEALYRDNPIPLTMVSKFTGASVFDLWDGFSRDPRLGLKSALGVPGEFKAGRSAAGQGVTIVDPLSLYAWTRLGIAETILKSQHRLAVVQATIDMLRQLVEEREAQRGRKMGTFGWDGERYRLVHLDEETVDQQVADASAALALAESLLLVATESERVMPDNVADLIKDLDPVYRETLIAALHPHRSILTDDLGFRIIAQEAGAAATWTQAFAQVGHGLDGLSHPDYRNVVGALLDANYRFTQFGHADVLGELHETGWTINDRLRRYARLMISESIDRASIAGLLAQLLIDSRLHAPDDRAFAAFHVEYAEACRDADRVGQMKQDYEAVAHQAHALITRSVNQMLLPSQLMSTTQMTPPMELTRDSRRIAVTQVKRMWEGLSNGGLSLDPGGS